LGLSTAEIKGKSMREALGEQLFNQTLPYVEQVLKGRPQTYEIERVGQDGIKRHNLVNYIPHFVGDIVEGFLAIVTDITPLKEMESQRQLLQSQLNEASKLATLGEMAGGVAHEINTPLAIIQGKVGQLTRKVLSGEIESKYFLKNLNVIDETVERMAKIIRGLKIYSRNGSGDPFEEVDLKALAEDTLNMCQERFNRAAIDVEFVCDSPLRIQCRGGEISQILMNLLSNAIDAVEPLTHRKIKVEIKLQSKMAKILISDSGPGIPETIALKIMQPFFTTKKVGKGTGLGLSISKGIAEVHGGSLVYDSSFSNTTFVLSLPIRQPDLKGTAA
jgi:C4-dicarboxylate-specific signal transduction histidine kinase